MEEYKNYILNLANNSSNVVFYNSGNEHAAFVMSTIFEHSHNEVKIYAGDFLGNVSDQDCYRQALDQYLRTGGKLKVLLNKYDTLKTRPKIFEILKFHKLLNKDSVLIKSYAGKLIDTRANTEVHFTIAKSANSEVFNMYRLENNIEEYTATGNFNDSETSGILSSLYDEIFSDSDKSKDLEI